MNLEGRTEINKRHVNNAVPTVLKMNIHFRNLLQNSNRNNNEIHPRNSEPETMMIPELKESKPWKILRELSDPFLLDEEDIETFH